MTLDLVLTRKSDEFAKVLSGHLTNGFVDVDRDEAEDDVDGEVEAVQLLDPNEDVDGVHLRLAALQVGQDDPLKRNQVILNKNKQVDQYWSEVCSYI